MEYVAVAKDKHARFRRFIAQSAEPNTGDATSVLVDLGARIKIASERIGTQQQAADAIGVSPNQFGRYIRGESEAAVLPMVALARKANVSLEWLLTGADPGPNIQSAIDETLLRDVISALEMQLERAAGRLAVDKKAEAVVLLYELFRESKPSTAQAQAHVGRVLKLVAG